MFTCKGCREVTRLVGEVEDLRQMMESMKRIVTGRGLEEKGEETGDRMAELGEAEKCEEVITPDNSTEEPERTDTRRTRMVQWETSWI